MKLDITDLSRLYGPLLFVVDEKENAEVEEVAETKESENSQESASKEKFEAVSEKKPEEIVEEIVEEKVPEPVAIPAILTSGSAITWKLKANAKMAFVMDLSEFKDRNMTGFLKQCIDAAAIPTGSVGFGVLDANASSWDFSNLPVPNVWAFGTAVGFVAEPFDIGGNQLFTLEKLASIINDPSQKEIFIQQLKNA